jgi:hypothetical protein
MDNLSSFHPAACGFANQVSSEIRRKFDGNSTEIRHFSPAISHGCIREAASGGKENCATYSCAQPQRSVKAQKEPRTK